MYDEVDPTCDKVKLAIAHLSEWTGRRLFRWLNMSYDGSNVHNVAWGKANREHHVDVDFARLM